MTQLTLFFLLATLVEGIVEYAGDTVPAAIKQHSSPSRSAWRTTRICSPCSA